MSVQPKQEILQDGLPVPPPQMRSFHVLSTNHVQRILDENQQLLFAVNEAQDKRRFPAMISYMERLQQNLIYLSMMADQAPSASDLIKATSTTLQTQSHVNLDPPVNSLYTKSSHDPTLPDSQLNNTDDFWSDIDSKMFDDLFLSNPLLTPEDALPHFRDRLTLDQLRVQIQRKHLRNSVVSSDSQKHYHFTAALPHPHHPHHIQQLHETQFPVNPLPDIENPDKH